MPPMGLIRNYSLQSNVKKLTYNANYIDYNNYINVQSLELC